MSEHRVILQELHLAKNKTTDSEELEKLAAFQDLEVERHESTQKSCPKSMIQQLNCYPNTIKIELSEFLRGLVAATVLIITIMKG